MRIQNFLHLPVVNLLTTQIGIMIWLGEPSPIVRWLMQMDPAVGFAASRLIAFALGGLCLWLNKCHPVRWINYWYAGLVSWNMTLILGVLRAG